MYEPSTQWESLNFAQLKEAKDAKFKELEQFTDAHKLDGQYRMTQDEANEFQARQKEVGAMSANW